MEVNRISFEALKSYWSEVDHFGDPHKKVRAVVRQLGPYRSPLDDPRRESYGLFDDGQLVGVTHLVQWNDDWLRYRTLNVRSSHRGRDLGWFLLSTALDQDWRDWQRPGRYLFGWIRRDHLAWSEAHGFRSVDGRWHDDHTAMIKPLAEA